jgi:hypothetical protein
VTKNQGILLKRFAYLLDEMHFNNRAMQNFPSRCWSQATKKKTKTKLALFM